MTHNYSTAVTRIRSNHLLDWQAYHAQRGEDAANPSTPQSLSSTHGVLMQPVTDISCLSKTSPFGFWIPLQNLYCVGLPCRKKGKRKREAEEAARAQETAVEETLSSGAAADGADAEMSGSDGERKRDGVEDSDKEAGEEVNDMLTPAQRRFREKQLEREVNVSLAPLRGKAFKNNVVGSLHLGSKPSLLHYLCCCPQIYFQRCCWFDTYLGQGRMVAFPNRQKRLTFMSQEQRPA